MGKYTDKDYEDLAKRYLKLLDDYELLINNSYYSLFLFLLRRVKYDRYN